VKNGGGFVDPYEAKLAAAKEKENEGATASFASPALKKVTPGAKAEPGFFVRQNVRDAEAPLDAREGP